jgi:hypothetical protein
MSVEFLRVTHASRVLASASSPGQWRFRFSCPSSSGLPVANGPAEYLGAFFRWLRSLHREILKRPAVTLYTKKLRGDL